MTEKWDLYDENRMPLGILRDRFLDEVIEQGQYHLIVALFIINDQKELLIQKRSENKVGWPGLWADTGGAVIAGENTLQGVKRECHEELGLEFKEEDFHLLCSHKIDLQDHHYFRDVFVVHKNIDLQDCSLDYNEVSEIKWATIDEIMDMMEAGTYIQPNENYMEVIKEYVISL